jgi:ATP-dependent DNA ligase
MNTKDKNVAKLDLDLVVMGANKGKGYKNFESLTSFLVGCQFGGNIIPISNVGSGLNE